MTIDEMRTRLNHLGVTKAFKSFWESESEAILLKTRRPAMIVDGFLKGSEIALTRDATEFKVWSSRKKKAKAVAVKRGLKVRLMDGEAELMVPCNLADEILPMFGARARRRVSPKQLEVLKSARDASRLQNLGQNPCAEGVTEA